LRECESKADSLASRLGTLFKDRKGIRVVRPVRKVEFYLLDLDDSVTASEIVEAVVVRGSA